MNYAEIKNQIATIKSEIESIRTSDINESILRNAEYYSYYSREDFWKNDIENKQIEGFNTKVPAYQGFPELYSI